MRVRMTSLRMATACMIGNAPAYLKRMREDLTEIWNDSVALP